MSPEERLVIQSLGINLVFEGIANAATASLWSGIMIPMFIIIIQYLNGMPTKHRITLSIVSIGLVGTASLCMLGVWQSIIAIDLLAGITTTPPLKQLDSVNSKLDILGVAQSWIIVLLPVVNDGFIIWRAWIILGEQRWTTYLSVALCMCTFVIAISSLIMISVLNTFESSDIWEASHGPYYILNYTSTGLSLAINTISTSYVAWTLWTYLSALPSNLRSLFTSWRILWLLVDSGLIYMLLQVTAIVVARAVPGDIIGSNVFTVITDTYYFISLAYPSITIFLIYGPFSIRGVHETVASFKNISDPEVAQPGHSPS